MLKELKNIKGSCASFFSQKDVVKGAKNKKRMVCELFLHWDQKRNKKDSKILNKRMLCELFVIFCSFNMSTKGLNFFQQKNDMRSVYKKDAVKGAPHGKA